MCTQDSRHENFLSAETNTEDNVHTFLRLNEFRALIVQTQFLCLFQDMCVDIAARSGSYKSRDTLNNMYNMYCCLVRSTYTVPNRCTMLNWALARWQVEVLCIVSRRMHLAVSRWSFRTVQREEVLVCTASGSVKLVLYFGRVTSLWTLICVNFGWSEGHCCRPLIQLTRCVVWFFIHAVEVEFASLFDRQTVIWCDINM